jgi:hypothetical protein
MTFLGRPPASSETIGYLPLVTVGKDGFKHG